MRHQNSESSTKNSDVDAVKANVSLLVRRHLERAKSRLQRSSQRNQEHLTQVRWLSEMNKKLRADLTAADEESQPIKGPIESEKSEETHELAKKILAQHGFVQTKKNCSSQHN